MQATYLPMVWSAFGREHPATSATLETLARAAARRRGWRDHRLVLSRTRTAVAVQIVCRAVRMTRATLPSIDEEQAAVVDGPALRTVRLLGGDADVAGPEEEEDAEERL